MFLVVMSLISSVNHTLDNDRRGAATTSARFWRSAAGQREVATLAEELPGVAYAEAWQYARNATILREGERLTRFGGAGAQLTGIPVETEMQRPLIVNGRWFQPGDERVLASSGARRRPTNRIGVGGDHPAGFGQPGRGGMAGGGHLQGGVRRRLCDRSAVRAAARRHGRHRPGGPGMSLLYVQTESEDEEVIATVYPPICKTCSRRATWTSTCSPAPPKGKNGWKSRTSFSRLWACLSAWPRWWPRWAAWLMGSLGISVVERTREIGVMRAIGARSPTIVSLFIMEGVLQGVLSWLVAVPLAFFISQPLARLLGQTMLEIDLDYAFNGTAVFIWLISIILISVLAAIWPARQATRISVRESLAYA
ncbi:MAG: FtsX-like permease family protein [Chloroflexota bacterium]